MSFEVTLNEVYQEFNSQVESAKIYASNSASALNNLQVTIPLAPNNPEAKRILRAEYANASQNIAQLKKEISNFEKTREKIQELYLFPETLESPLVLVETTKALYKDTLNALELWFHTLKEIVTSIVSMKKSLTENKAP